MKEEFPGKDVEVIKTELLKNYDENSQKRIKQFKTKLSAVEAEAMGEGSLQEKIKKLEETKDARYKEAQKELMKVREQGQRKGSTEFDAIISKNEKY